MIRTREAWHRVIKDGDYKISDLMRLMEDWRDAETDAAEEHEKKLDALSDKLHEAEEESEDLKEQMAEASPEWGNCKRGCPPSYLDHEGFCSPACSLGHPRGEYVTLPKLMEVGMGVET